MKTSASKDPASTRSVLEVPYALASITRATSPIADDTREWHSYVIVQGTNQIIGHRPGSEQSVRLAAQDLVLRLNERRSFRPGRKNLVIAGSAVTAAARPAIRAGTD